MKKLTLIILAVLISSSILAQDKIITPPLSLSFGMSDVAFKTIMNKNGTYSETKTQDYGKSISYDLVNIGSSTATIFTGKFVNNKLFEINMYYLVEDEDIQDKYDEICEIISNKYGKGDEKRVFRYPYEDGDEDFVQAVKGGYTDIITFWIFTNALSVEILKVPAIKVIYQSDSLYNEVEKIINGKNKDQF
jgi:hypothetical protein